MGANAILQVNARARPRPGFNRTDLHARDRCYESGAQFRRQRHHVRFRRSGLEAADGMRHMKRDMAGGAVTLAAIEAVAKLKLPVSVKCIVAATENMADGKAYKPGDVIHTMGGIAVEVDNTDAEGRLTLAEHRLRQRSRASLASSTWPHTGAVKQISGDVAAGAFSNDDAFLAVVDQAATAVARAAADAHVRRAARLQRHRNRRPEKLRRSPDRSTTAAFFIREFVEYGGNSGHRVRLDIAGTAYRDRELGADPKGATGLGVRAP